ncbi:hypothetical protein Tco_1003612 [Tanacetum coccineum]|uniref:Uncharacterized protein n=1 Tax=Tanacetum coccineum TaxID=301880 RepID=A0ABQ5FAP3_9ASTR
MPTLAYVDSEFITQADGAQSSRVPVLLPDDPYVASLGSRVPLMGEEFVAVEPSGTRTDSSHSSISSYSTTPLSPDHPFTHFLPTPTPTRVSFHRSIALMAMHTQSTLSPGMSASVAEATALSPSSFRKRYRSSYETSSSSSQTFPMRKRYRDTSELILDTDSEGDKLGDEDIDEDEKDESSDADDEGQGLDDEGRGLDDEIHSVKSDGLGLEEEEEAIP